MDPKKQEPKQRRMVSVMPSGEKEVFLAGPDTLEKSRKRKPVNVHWI